MPTLDWIGKQAVVNHHREVPYRLVHCDSDLSAGDPNAGNLLVQGDNLEALRALLPYYAGQVKCIYIDPPYNTGNEGWVYNDNVNSPEIKAWLDTVVGKEGEDLSRHDKWLCMMYPRLRLLREFLREDGVIFISIDENAFHLSIALLEEIFGGANQIAQMVWSAGRKNDSKHVSVSHEYLLVWARNKKALKDAQPEWRTRKKGIDDIYAQHRRIMRTFGQDHKEATKQLKSWFKSLEQGDPAKRHKHYNHIDSRGVYFPADISWPGGGGPSYEVLHPDSGKPVKKPTRGWVTPNPDKMNRWIDEKRVHFGESEDEVPKLKAYLENNEEEVPYSVFYLDGRAATKRLRNILGKRDFGYPKDETILREVFGFVTQSNDLILDSFAGSGTTGHAVLDLNKQDGGNRRFILVEMDENISKDVTAERLRRVIGGYDKGGDSSKPVEGLGGGFRYCQLGKPLFDEYGDIAPEVTFPDLAAHIFFSETGVPIPAKAASAYLGTFQNRAVYLLFDAAHAEAPREAVGNVLTPDRLDALPAPPEDADGKAFDGLRVVYGEGCTVSAGRLKSAGVVFKQIPYQIDGA